MPQVLLGANPEARLCCVCGAPIGAEGLLVQLHRHRVTPNLHARHNLVQRQWFCARCEAKAELTWPGKRPGAGALEFICAWCGQRRTARKGNQRFCNDRCLWKWHADNDPSRQRRRLATVGMAPIFTAHPEQYLGRRAENGMWYFQCQECGLIGLAPSKFRRWCSQRCHDRHRYPVDQPEACLCGAPLPGTNRSRRYCSRRCRAKAQRARRRARLEVQT